MVGGIWILLRLMFHFYSIQFLWHECKDKNSIEISNRLINKMYLPFVKIQYVSLVIKII